jgi:hypothetical protein
METLVTLASAMFGRPITANAKARTVKTAIALENLILFIVFSSFNKRDAVFGINYAVWNA